MEKERRMNSLRAGELDRQTLFKLSKLSADFWHTSASTRPLRSQRTVPLDSGKLGKVRFDRCLTNRTKFRARNSRSISDIKVQKQLHELGRSDESFIMRPLHIEANVLFAIKRIPVRRCLMNAHCQCGHCLRGGAWSEQAPMIWPMVITIYKWSAV